MAISSNRGGKNKAAATPVNSDVQTVSPESLGAVATATPSAAPGAPAAEGEKVAKPRKKLVTVEYPGEFDDKGVRINKLTEIPEDYKTTLHKPLKKSDFVDEETFLLARAKRFEDLAAKLRKQAETIKSMGDTAQRGAAKKLLRMQDSMKTLMATLASQGVDVNALLASAQVTANDEGDEAAE